MATVATVATVATAATTAATAATAATATAEALNELSMELDALQADGELTVVVKDTGPERGRRVYYAPLRGAPACEELRRLWNAAKPPDTPAELAQALVKRGLRTPEQLKAREERRKARNNAANQAAKQARAAARKKPVRVGRMRNAPQGSLAALQAED